MKRLIILICLALMSIGCAETKKYTYKWSKPDATVQEIKKDRLECRKNSLNSYNQGSLGQKSLPKTGNAVMDLGNTPTEIGEDMQLQEDADALFRECMKSRGYTREQVNPK